MISVGLENELSPRIEQPLTLEQGRALADSGAVIATPSAYQRGKLAGRTGWEGRRSSDRRNRDPRQAESRDCPAAVPPRLLPACRRMAAGDGPGGGDRGSRPRHRAGAVAPNRACHLSGSAPWLHRRRGELPGLARAGCARASSCVATTGFRSRWRSATTSSRQTSPRTGSCAPPASECLPFRV